MTNMKYISSRISSYGWSDIVYVEFETSIYWFIKSLPGVLGYVLRYLYFKLFLKSLKSFCWIQPNVTILYAKYMKVGKNLAINTNTYINAMGEIEIGDNVLIGPNVVISSGYHQYKDVTIPINHQKIGRKNITIENDVWIGANVVIMPGVKISSGCVIGAGSVVTKSTNENEIVVGVPARVMGKR